LTQKFHSLRYCAISYKFWHYIILS